MHKIIEQANYLKSLGAVTKKVKDIEISEEEIKKALKCPSDFGWFGRDEMFETWSLGDIIETRDSDILTRANAKALLDSLEEIKIFEDEWELNDCNHFLCGNVNHVSFHAIDEKGKPTLIFKWLKQWFEALQDYGVADEELYSEMQREEYNKLYDEEVGGKVEDFLNPFSNPLNLDWSGEDEIEHIVDKISEVKLFQGYALFYAQFFLKLTQDDENLWEFGDPENSIRYEIHDWLHKQFYPEEKEADVFAPPNSNLVRCYDKEKNNVLWYEFEDNWQEKPSIRINFIWGINIATGDAQKIKDWMFQFWKDWELDPEKEWSKHEAHVNPKQLTLAKELKNE